MNADAIIWDYDGTLVNSAPKNIDITKQILNVVAPRLTGENLPTCLANEATYHLVNHRAKNWQDLYLNYYGMTETEMKDAGVLWTEFQLKNTTAVELYPGIKETIQQLQLPQAICSQNSSENIRQLLNANDLLNNFHTIIGYDDIPHHVQKPLPDGGIICLKKIFSHLTERVIIYIGDHEADVIFARNIETTMRQGNNKVIAVTVTYSGADINSWTYQPDIVISHPSELLQVIN